MQFGPKIIEWETSSEPIGEKKNIYKRTAVQSLDADGSVTFSDRVREENIDTVMFATGYFFSFPFLSDAGIVSVNDNR